MILTNNKNVYLKSKSLRNLCFEINRFNHDDIGYNYRLTNIQAAIGCAQLKNIKWIVKRKMEIGNRYYKHLKIIKIYLFKNHSTNIQKIYTVVEFNL